MKTVIFTEQDKVGYIKLNRPEMRNAFNSEMIAELTQLFRSLQSRTDLRVLILSGEGKVFCSGADLNWMKSMVDFTVQENKIDAQGLYDMFQAQLNIDLPLLGWIQGAAFGGALGLIANCDYVIAEEGTSFCFSEVRLGISPAVISSFVLRKTNSSIHHFMLSAEVFNEVKSKELGLIHHITEKNRGMQDLEKIITMYKNNGPSAVRNTKKLLRELPHLNWNEHAQVTTKLIAELRTSPEGQEGIKGFLEKRNPSWKSV